MKKHIIILTFLVGSCMAGCGTTDVSGSDSSKTVTVSELTNVYADTAYEVQPEIPNADILTTENVDESEKTADVSELENTYSAADLEGEWSAPDSFCMNNTTMTIQSDGTFYVRYAAGGTRSGKVYIEQTDGVNYYSFCEDSAEPWMRYVCGDKPANQLNAEQSDGMNFVRIS